MIGGSTSGSHDDHTGEPLEGKLDFKTYLRLEQLLTAQRPLSSPSHHDELLFIVFARAHGQLENQASKAPLLQTYTNGQQLVP